jgi:hypothetical protein
MVGAMGEKGTFKGGEHQKRSEIPKLRFKSGIWLF